MLNKIATVLLILSTLFASAHQYKPAKIPVETFHPDNTPIEEVLFEPTDLPEPEFKIKLTFAGDCMLATEFGAIRDYSFSKKALEGDWEWFFGGVMDYFKNDDFTIVNLENVLSDKKLSPVKKDHSPAYWYIAPTENTNILTSSSVEIVNLSNNHTGDYGSQGAEDTIKACEDAGLEYGNGNKTVYFEKEGFRIALICNGLWSEWQAETIVNRINEAKENADYIIVYYHGGKEGIHKPEDWKVRASHKIVDAGADLVIGNHPHVLQPEEVYNGVHIIYSIGNFCFGGNNYPENRTMLYSVELTVNRDTKEFTQTQEVVPCYVYTGNRNNYRPEVITDENDKEQVLKFMRWESDLPY